MATNTSHPFLPATLVIPNYRPNERSLAEILGYFFFSVFLLLVIVWRCTDRLAHLKSKPLTRAKLAWFVLSGIIHCVIEGYYAVSHRDIAGNKDFIAELMKEYSMADSRYMISDTCIVCMESITAFIDGPLAFWTVYAFVCICPSRHVAQLSLSICQLYGTLLYFGTEMKDSFIHGRAGHPLYFWFYFIFLNGCWILIPSACIVESSWALTTAQGQGDCKENDSKKQ